MRLVAVGEGADQHRQVDAGDAFDPARARSSLRGDVAGRRAVDVGEDQHAVAVVELASPASRACGSRLTGSSWTVTPSCCNCGGRLPSTWLAQWIRLSPSVPCAMIRMPIMVSLLEPAVTIEPQQSTSCCAALRRVAAAWQLQARARVRSSASTNMPATSKPVCSRDLVEAGRAGDVDLGEVVADHVEADQQQAAPRERRPERVSRSRGRAPSAAARRRVPPAARLPRVSPGFGNAREAVAARLAADQQDALVAVAISGMIALRHHRARARACVTRLDDDVAVRIVVGARGTPMRRPCRPAASGSRRACSSMKAWTALRVARHQRRRDELAGIARSPAFRCGRGSRAVVEHARALALGELRAGRSQ